MASIKIHQDIANFERRRRGFTTRQIMLMAAAVGVFILFMALLAYLLEVPFDISIYISIIPALFLAFCAFFDYGGMHFEEFCSYVLAHFRRGSYVLLQPEEDITWSKPPKNSISREYKKLCKKRGFECYEKEGSQQEEKERTKYFCFQ